MVDTGDRLSDLTIDTGDCGKSSLLGVSSLLIVSAATGGGVSGESTSIFASSCFTLLDGVSSPREVAAETDLEGEKLRSLPVAVAEEFKWPENNEPNSPAAAAEDRGEVNC